MRFWLWWSFYVSALSARRLKKGPISDLEDRLGHRLKIIWLRPDLSGRRNIFHIEASSWLNASSQEEAVSFFVAHIERIAMTPTRVLAEDPEEELLLGLYWTETIDDARFVSSGVQLKPAADNPDFVSFYQQPLPRRSKSDRELPLLITAPYSSSS